MSFRGLIGALRVDLSMNSAAFQQGAAEAQSAIARMRTGMRRAGAAMTGVGTRLSVGVTGSMAGVAAAASRSADAMIGLQDAARLANSSSEDFRILSIAAQQYGVDQAKLADMMKDVNDKFGEFSQLDTGPMADFFEKIAPQVGLTADNFRSLSAPDAMQLYVTALEQANISQSDMMFYMEALASDGSALLPMFQNNGAAIDSVREKAGEFGVTINEDLIDAARKSREEFAIVKDVLTTQVQQALIGLLPVVTSVAESFVPKIQEITDKIKGLAEWFQNLSPHSQQMAVKIAGITAAIGPALVAFGLTISAISKIGILFSPAGLLITGLSAVATGALYLYQNWDELSTRWPILQAGLDVAKQAFGAVKTVINEFIDVLHAVAETIQAVFSGDWAAAWEGAKAIAVELFQAWSATMGGLPGVVLQSIIDIGAAIAEQMGQLIEDFKQFGRDLIAGLVEGVQAKIQEAKDVVTNLAESIKSAFRLPTRIQSPSKVFAGYGENIVQGLTIGINRTADQAVEAVESVADRMTEAAEKAVTSLRDTLIDGIASGDLAGGVKDAFSGLVKAGQDAFSGVLKDVFSGGGLGAIADSIKTSFAGARAALSGGAGLAGIGGAIGSMLPVIGMVSSIVGLISSFGGKEQIGSELQLGIKNGRVGGAKVDTFEKTAFWGLFKSTVKERSGIGAELRENMQRQVGDIQDAVKRTYAAAGIKVRDAVIKGFDFNLGTVDLAGRTEQEVAAEIAARFQNYTQALSESIGGVGLQAVATFAEVQSVLKPAGMALRGSIRSMAGAAEDLAKLFGGTDIMAGQVSRFVSNFFSESEQIDMMRRNLRDVFADLNLRMPRTIEGFKNLVTAQNLMTDRGREIYAALIGVSDQFAAVARAAEEAAAAEAAAKAAAAEAAANAAKDQASAAEKVAEVVKETAREVDAAFGRMAGWYRSEFDERLAAIAQARGYTVAAELAETGMVRRVGGAELSAGDGQATVVLRRMLALFEDWDGRGITVGGAY